MNYLAIITRSDFTNLYKFGHIHLHNLVPFDGNLKDHINDKKLFDAVTKYIDTYEYATEYLLLHITKEVFTEPIVEININDVKAVYALSEEAKRSLQVSLDSRINIQVSMWESMFAELNIEQAIKQAKTGLNNCLELFGITPSEKSEISEILPKNLVEEVYQDVFNNVRPSNNASIWNYLMRYERHNPYWNDKRGFFMDAVHVYESHRQGHEIEYGIVDEMPIGDTISDCPNVFTTILQKLNETGENNYNFYGWNYLVAAPLFLYLKAEFKDGGITPSKFEQNRALFVSLHKNYGVDFGIAISLLGLSLGQDLTYNCVYQHNHIGIFDTTQEDIDAKNSESESSNVNHTTKEYLLNLIETKSEEIRMLKEKINKIEGIREEILPTNMESSEEDSVKEPIFSEVSVSVNYEAPNPSKSDSLTEAVTMPKFVKERQEDISSQDSEELSISELDTENNTSSDTNAPNYKESFTPIEMFKLNRNGTAFDKRVKQPRLAQSEEEFKKNLYDGYAPRNYFDNENSMFSNL